MDGNNSSIDNSSLFSITAGSYEGSLFVWDVTKNDNNDLQTKMTAGFHCCVGSIKAIAVSESGNCLVCGGMDEKIRIFNMKDKKSTGELSTHTGAITSLKFYKDSHLLSGSEDSTICIWRMYDWACIHILGGHKGPVHDISIHPSGKLALSVSRDKTMKIWNLIEGRIAFTRRLSGAAERVLWSEDGTYYLLVFQKEVQVYVAEDNSLTCTLQHDLRVNQALFLQHPPPTPQISLATAVAAADGGGGGGVVKEAMTGTGMGMGMVVVTISECDGGSLNVFDLTGNKVGTWHLGDVLGGRPKDMSLSHYQQQHIPVPVSTNTSTTTTAASSTTNGYHTAVVIVSSTGTILTVCGDKLMAGKVSREALLSVVSTTAEPRFTCVSVWNNSHTGSKGKRKRHRQPDNNPIANTTDQTQNQNNTKSQLKTHHTHTQNSVVEIKDKNVNANDTKIKSRNNNKKNQNNSKNSETVTAKDLAKQVADKSNNSSSNSSKNKKKKSKLGRNSEDTKE